MKQDDRGVSLVEILIATAILVICVVPLFKSMIQSVVSCNFGRRGSVRGFKSGRYGSLYSG